MSRQADRMLRYLAWSFAWRALRRARRRPRRRAATRAGTVTPRTYRRGQRGAAGYRLGRLVGKLTR